MHYSKEHSPSALSIEKINAVGRSLSIQQEMDIPILSKDKFFVAFGDHYPMGKRDMKMNMNDLRVKIKDTVERFCQINHLPLFAASWWPVYSKLGADSSLFTTSLVGLDEKTAKECKLIGFVIVESLTLNLYYDIESYNYDEIEKAERELLESELYLMARWKDGDLYTVCLDDGKGERLEEYVMRWKGDSIDAVIEDLLSEIAEA